MIATSPTIENPFSSRHIQPGALPFLFTSGETPAGLLQRFDADGLWGQIIGPHGSGKSTLLGTLLPQLQSRGLDIVHGAYRGGRFRWLTDVAARPAAGVQRIVVIDGFERLSLLSRWYWKLRCWRRGDGLLVTAHRDLGLPTLYQTEVTPQLAQRVVDQLLADGDAGIFPLDVKEALGEHHSDLRSTLFALYDLYEFRRPKRLDIP